MGAHSCLFVKKNVFSDPINLRGSDYLCVCVCDACMRNICYTRSTRDRVAASPVIGISDEQMRCVKLTSVSINHCDRPTRPTDRDEP